MFVFGLEMECRLDILDQNTVYIAILKQDKKLRIQELLKSQFGAYSHMNLKLQTEAAQQ